MKTKTIQTMTSLARAAIEDPVELGDVLIRLEGKPEHAKRDKLLTSREAAEIAKVHKKTILAWGRKGLLTPRRITRRRVRFSRNELEQFLGETTEA